MKSMNWQRSIDQIMLTGAGGENRILGLTSIRRGAGVSLISRALARTVACAGMKVLLVDLSEATGVVSREEVGGDLPCNVRDLIEPSEFGFDVLVGHSDETHEKALCNLPRLQRAFASELTDYACVVVDLPPVLNEEELGVNSVAAGAMCDRLLLVTRIGKDKRREMTDVVSLFAGAGVHPSALLANEFRG